MIDPVQTYAAAVLAGAIVAGPGVRAACQRHLDDLEHGPARGLRWDPEKAQLALDFFPECLRLAEGAYAGKPFVLQPWQQFIVGSLFGWIGADGFRRFRMAYLEIGKGSGKTPMAAGVALYLLMADDEEGAEIFAAAVTKDQAAICFRDAARMVAASPELASRILASGVNPVYNLAHVKSGSFFRPVSAEGRSLDGKRPHGVIVDELHEHDSPIVLEKLSAGFKGRRQPLMLMITNSGFDRTSVCFSYHEYAGRAVSAKPGEVGFDDQFFSFVCGLDEDDPFESEACWLKANPNLGVSVTLDYLRKQVREARGIPSKASLVRRLNFCEWTDSADPWIDGPTWRACEVDPGIVFTGRDVTCSLDFSGTRDLTALTTVSTDAEGVMDARVEFWIPGDTIQARMGANQPPWDAWVEAGYVHAPPGRVVSYEAVAHRLAEIASQCNLIAVGFDAYQIKFFEVELQRLGITLPLIAHPQGTFKSAESMLWMPHSIELTEKRLFEKTIRIERNPCLWWNAQCAAIETDRHNNRTFSKKKSRGAIDGVVSLCMGVGTSESGVKAEKKAYQMFFV